MKELVSLLLKKSLIYKSLIKIDKKRLGTKKRIDIYEAVDIDSYYTAIFVISQKSRFLKKNGQELEMLYKKLVHLQDHNYKYKILLFNMPICSHAKALLKEFGWRVIDATI